MQVIDYNGEGRWSREALVARYASYAAKAGVAPHDLSPTQTEQRGRRWVYPVMDKVIDGIVAGDPACVRLGIEFIEEDGRFPFGRTLKANAARALRRASLSDEQRHRIRRRLLAMATAGTLYREYREFLKLARAVGVTAEELDGGRRKGNTA